MTASTSRLTRRGFVAGAVATGALAAGSVSRAWAQDGAEFTESCDVVVVGYGLAGARASLAAADAGAERVLLIDVAPKGHEGGNSRYCAQCCAFANDRDEAIAYYTALAGEMGLDPEVVEVFADGLVNMEQEFNRIGIAEPVVTRRVPEDELDPGIAMLNAWGMPEYPELPGSGTMDTILAHMGTSDAFLYLTAQEAVEACEAVEVWYESPALRLVRDSETGTITGVIVGHEGAEVAVEATKGVVLACGGFECNTEMIKTYLGLPYAVPKGGLYNNGDGIRMAQAVGADLWHMSIYESFGIFGSYVPKTAPGERYPMTVFFPSAGSIISVASDGTRFVREGDVWSRHGHVFDHGEWYVPNICNHPFMVFDEKQKAAIDESGQMLPGTEEDTLSASSVEELAELMGVDPTVLAGTIERYNGYAEAGFDPEFDRDPATMLPLDLDGTLYAHPLNPSILNTQGGPRRNAKAQVVGIDGMPIPHLYSAGECGGITAHLYQGASNIAECMVFGAIAGTNVVELA